MAGSETQRGSWYENVLPRGLVGRLSRCMCVSIGTTLLSAIVLAALTVGASMPAGSANVIAVMVGIFPSYFANRAWVWGVTGRSSFAREIAPFWGLSLAGLVLSTAAVSAVASLMAQSPASQRAVALPLANGAAFGALWLVQFFVLNRFVFRPS